MKNDILITQWLGSHYQLEFPIADERYQDRFNSLLALIKNDVKNAEILEKTRIVSIIKTFSLILENNIEILRAYNIQPVPGELKLEAHPVSYSLKIFTIHFKILERKLNYLKKEFVSKETLCPANNLEAKEFDPG